jgi:hypothetical protein
MISVYLQNKTYSTLIAKFADDEIYQLCFPTLQKEASTYGWIITETKDENPLED